MIAHAFIGNSLSRGSRYYLDPNHKNGECRTIKPADPEKVAAWKEKRSAMKHYKSMNFYGKKNKLATKLVKEIIEFENNHDTLQRIHS